MRIPIIASRSRSKLTRIQTINLIGLRFRAFPTVEFMLMTIPFRCAEGTKRYETSTSNAAVKNLLEYA